MNPVPGPPLSTCHLCVYVEDDQAKTTELVPSHSPGGATLHADGGWNTKQKHTNCAIINLYKPYGIGRGKCMRVFRMNFTHPLYV